MIATCGCLLFYSNCLSIVGHRVIDKEEFKKIMAWMRSHTRAGKTHSDGRRTGLHVTGDVEDAGLVELFFGKDGTRKLPMEQFEQFLKDLHNEVCSTTSMDVS